jgi:hypothetical protein
MSFEIGSISTPLDDTSAVVQGLVDIQRMHRMFPPLNTRPKSITCKCAVCGRKFKAAYPLALYCRDQCRRDASNERAKQRDAEARTGGQQGGAGGEFSKRENIGRPLKFQPKTIEWYREKFYPGESDRSIQNKVCRSKAIRVLSGRKGFNWLFDPAANAVQGILLTELGRIEDLKALLIVARILCECRPPARWAAAVVRRWRLSTRPDLAAWELKLELKSLRREFPDAPPSFVFYVIQQLRQRGEGAVRYRRKR